MRTIFLIFIWFAFITASVAQSFQWGYPFGGDREDGFQVSHVVDGDIFRIKSIYNLGTFDYQITADRYNANNLEKSGTIDLSIPRAAIGVRPETHHSMFQTNGTNFVFFLTIPDREAKKNAIYWQTVDIKTGEKSNPQLLSEIQGLSNSNNGSFYVDKSPNGEFFAVLENPAFDKKGMQSIKIKLYDKDFNEIDKIEHEFELPAERAPNHFMKVGNNGDVYLIKKVKLKKMKPFETVFYWNKTGKTLEEHSLKQPDDYQISQSYLYFDEGHFYISALLTHRGSTSIGLNIDMDGRHSGTAGSALLNLKFDNGKVVYQMRNDFETPISNLSIKKIIPQEQNHYVIMEKAYVEKKTDVPATSATNDDYNYSYLSNGFFITSLNPHSGHSEWGYDINTSEPNTRNDNGAYLSVLPLIKDNNLVLIYNESRDVRTGKIHNIVLKRFPIMETISPKGETLNRIALTDAGVGVLEEEAFDLDTGVIVPLTNGKHLIRARSHAEYKYGYLQL